MPPQEVDCSSCGQRCPDAPGVFFCYYCGSGLRRNRLSEGRLRNVEPNEIILTCPLDARVGGGRHRSCPQSGESVIPITSGDRNFSTVAVIASEDGHETSLPKASLSNGSQFFSEFLSNFTPQPAPQSSRKGHVACPHRKSFNIISETEERTPRSTHSVRNSYDPANSKNIMSSQMTQEQEYRPCKAFAKMHSGNILKMT